MDTRTTNRTTQTLATVLSTIVVISAIAIGSPMFAGSAVAQDSNIQVGDSTDADYSTIQAAVDNASDGAVIGVEEGTYDQVVINRGDGDATDLEIRALGDRSETIISHSASDGTPTVAVDQDGVTIEGFTIERTGSGSTTAQAVRVAGNDVQLTDNSYTVDGESDAAIGILTSSSGAAGTPDVSGVTISTVVIDGGNIETTGTAGSPVGVLVADTGAADIEKGAVTISGATFSAAGSNSHVRELDTEGGVVDMASTLADNDFDTAATPDATDATLGSYNVDGLLTSTIQDSIDAAAADATITVAGGTYDENLVINRDVDPSNLTLQAADGATPTITFSANGGTPTVAVDQDGVTIEGFTIQRGSSGSNTAQAVRVTGTDIDLTDNTYKLVNGPNDAAIAVLTDSSGAAVIPLYRV